MNQLALGITLDDDCTLENFLPLPRSVALLRACETDGEPLQYLHGGEAAGKSHLLQAICQRRGASSFYLPLNELSSLDPSALLSGLESADLLALDDLQAVAGDARWEESLFHLVNRCRVANCPLWFASRVPVAELPIALADLSSRLAGGLVWPLPPYDDAEKTDILRFRARRRGLDLSDTLLAYLAKRGSRALHAQLALLDRLDAASLQQQRPLTVPLAREVLGW